MSRLLAAAGDSPLFSGKPDPAEISRLLAGWFTSNRREFSWRRADEPFHVLIAEILLRKTGAQAVEDFLQGFLDRYPSPAEILAASEDELIASLAPLGLSRQRAHQLHGLAARLLAEYKGTVPEDPLELVTLPGVGPYTAAIVSATCFEADPLGVDSNVARVLCRVFDLTPSHAEARKSTNVWEVAAALGRSANQPAAELNWAVLDLAASLCTARKPRCPECPLRHDCLYAAKIKETGGRNQDGAN